MPHVQDRASARLEKGGKIDDAINETHGFQRQVIDGPVWWRCQVEGELWNFLGGFFKVREELGRVGEKQPVSVGVRINNSIGWMLKTKTFQTVSSPQCSCLHTCQRSRFMLFWLSCSSKLIYPNHAVTRSSLACLSTFLIWTLSKFEGSEIN